MQSELLLHLGCSFQAYKPESKDEAKKQEFPESQKEV